jgi:hypothetical protein
VQPPFLMSLPSTPRTSRRIAPPAGQKGGSGAQNSWMNEDFKRSDRTRHTIEHFGKLGVYHGYQDAAVFARNDGSKTVRYAFVIIGAGSPHRPRTGMDDLIFSIH